MQYTWGEPKDFNGLGEKKSLAAEWDRWIADRKLGASMPTASELSERRRSTAFRDILLRLWTYGENGGGQHNEMLDLYTWYGSEKISDAVMNFHRHRDLRRYCRRAT